MKSCQWSSVNKLLFFFFFKVSRHVMQRPHRFGLQLTCVGVTKLQTGHPMETDVTSNQWLTSALFAHRHSRQRAWDFSRKHAAFVLFCQIQPLLLTVSVHGYQTSIQYCRLTHVNKGMNSQLSQTQQRHNGKRSTKTKLFHRERPHPAAEGLI